VLLQVWGTSWGQPAVPGGIRSLWDDVGVSEQKRPSRDAYNSAFSSHFQSQNGVLSHQQAPPADVGAGVMSGGWGHVGFNGMNHRMPHAMSGTSNQAAFYRY
jgi:hypothetical protein